MALTADAVRGALGFLSRLPVGRDERAWAAFRDAPAAFPLSGYLVGALVALPLVVPLPAPTTAFAFVAWVYVVTGVNHVDGVADLGDALVVHGSPEERRAVLKDTVVGVGGALSVALAVAGLALAGLALAALPTWTALGLVVVAEVSAKFAMATLVCLGSAPHEGLGSQLTSRADRRSLALPAAVAAPAVLLAPLLAAAAALLGGVATAVALWRWAAPRLGGVNGDVVGAGNELARLVALHAGVVVWTHF